LQTFHQYLLTDSCLLYTQVSFLKLILQLLYLVEFPIAGRQGLPVGGFDVVDNLFL
jgi:hypothetical protein